MLVLPDRIFFSSPDEDTLTPFLEFITSATKSIHIADYSFNMKELIPILIAMKKAGIDIQLVLDKTQASGNIEASDLQQLKTAGISMTVGESDQHHIMHDKFVIIDGIKSLYGSWNFTDTATKEDNFYVIDSNSIVAAWFESILEKIKAWMQANEPQ